MREGPCNFCRVLACLLLLCDPPLSCGERHPGSRFNSHET
jgi:hypothetical protein